MKPSNLQKAKKKTQQMSKNYTETLPDGTAFELVFVEGGEKMLKFRNWDDSKQGGITSKHPQFFTSPKFPSHK
ncbi:MAG: hypothetical protein HC892_23525, partial [Saprospiraceae bacterium]|nr:hypothetical protein [Saprospiraceae bacterium]